MGFPRMSPPNTSALPLQQLRGFEAVARHLSFTNAARELGLTQSAVSQQVKLLELQLGHPLFLRRRPQLALTPAGRQLHAAVSRASGLIDRAVRRIARLAPHDVLTVAAAEPFASLVIEPARSRLQRVLGHVELRVAACRAQRQVRHAEADVLVCHYADGAAPPDAVELAPDLVSPACRPSLLVRPHMGAPDGLRRETLLRLDPEPDRRSRIDWARWFAANEQGGLQPATWVGVPSMEQAVQAAAAGQGVLLARLPLMGTVLRNGSLVLPWPHRCLRTGGWYARDARVAGGGAKLHALVPALREELRQLEARVSKSAWPVLPAR